MYYVCFPRKHKVNKQILDLVNGVPIYYSIFYDILIVPKNNTGSRVIVYCNLISQKGFTQ